MLEWNKAIYLDCMNEENGLPILEDKSIDLGITDPPYNTNHKGTQYTKKREFYKDCMTEDEYINWCLSWFKEMIRICKYVIFSPGLPNIWIYPKTKKILIHFKRDGQGTCSLSHLNKFELYLCYGEFPKKFKWNVLNFTCTKASNKVYKNGIIHPCPKPYNVWYYIINYLSPKSVIDPFLGSGTTAEVCANLGIKWLGYEIDEKYSQDINLRLENTKPTKRLIQKKLKII